LQDTVSKNGAGSYTTISEPFIERLNNRRNTALASLSSDVIHWMAHISLSHGLVAMPNFLI
jgi:hypothetical protein